MFVTISDVLLVLQLHIDLMQVYNRAEFSCVLFIYSVCSVYVCHCITPLKVAYLYRDGLETITGEVEFSQGEDLTHTLRKHTQTVVRQVQALQLRKPEERMNRGPFKKSTKTFHLFLLCLPYICDKKHHDNKCVVTVSEHQHSLLYSGVSLSFYNVPEKS